jgi:hypothetical protein
MSLMNETEGHGLLAISKEDFRVVFWFLLGMIVS